MLEWYCHIKSFNGAQVVFAQNEYGEAHNLLENNKNALREIINKIDSIK